MIINGNCLEELDKLDENSVDAIVTDPPYELNFMGKGWDNAGVKGHLLRLCLVDNCAVACGYFHFGNYHICSGSTGKAVMYENKERDAGYKFIGIELSEEYCKIAKARIGE